MPLIRKSELTTYQKERRKQRRKDHYKVLAILTAFALWIALGVATEGVSILLTIGAILAAGVYAFILAAIRGEL